MKNFSLKLFSLLFTFVLCCVLYACHDEKPLEGDLTPIPENNGILEVEFKLPPYKTIQNGIRRVDLALCHSMDEMYRGIFFYHSNVSDAKEIYQIYLPEGTYYYQAAITCTCSGDSCIQGGFPYGYGGIKFAFDQVEILKGEITRSQPSFQ